MKVLAVTDLLGRGGAEQQLLTILPALRDLGCQAELAVMRPPYDLQPDLEAAGIPVHHLPTGHKWNLPARARALARLARERKADVLHAHLYFPAVTLATCRLLGLHSGPAFVTFHNLAYAGANRAGPELYAKRWIASALYRRGIDQTLAVSQAVAKHYHQALRIEKPVVLHNALPLPPSPVLPPQRDVLRLVVPGRLVREKGHEDLIQALTMLRTQVEVVFAGGGPLHEDLARQAPDIQITGKLTHDQMMAQIADADLVVIPSRFEGFGLTALEAMALARPVIAAQVGGLPEVLGEVGVLTPAGDPVALASAIDALLDDPERRLRMGQAGRKRAQEHFAPPAIAGRLLSMYRAALEGGQS